MSAEEYLPGDGIGDALRHHRERADSRQAMSVEAAAALKRVLLAELGAKCLEILEARWAKYDTDKLARQIDYETVTEVVEAAEGLGLIPRASDDDEGGKA